MSQTIQLVLTPQQAASAEEIKKIAIETAHVNSTTVSDVLVKRKSIDARQKNIKVNLTVEILFLGEKDEIPDEERFLLSNVTNKPEVVIIGAGPAGFFAAFQLIERGFKPIIFERGKSVKDRNKDISAITKQGIVNPDSNWCFGEGGAGTYSDGKLYTRSSKRGNVRKVLRNLVENGAKEDILIDAHPHVGTDRLSKIVRSMRTTIIECGGEIHFNKKLTDIKIEGHKVKGITLNQNEFFACDKLIVATGHSARDIFELYFKNKIKIEAKPFALGVRIEHPQVLIDQIQYNCDRGDFLPPASYSVVEQVDERGVFSFCMCPGGQVVPSATAEGELVLNGMSNSRRNQKLANSGFVVEIQLSDIKNSDKNVFACLDLQKKVEQLCYQIGGGNLQAPAQRLVDFVDKKVSSSLPETSYHPGVISSNLNDIFPAFIHERMRKALKQLAFKKKQFYTNEALLLAVESRTSSPISVPRNPDTLQHVEIEGLFPCGEGAGYAGGIVSAALDGMRCADAVFKMES